MNCCISETSNLSDIYPDISEELCNKHAKLLSELKNRFTELYDDFEPEKYIIVNGVAKVVDLGAGLQVGLALENGVTVLYRKTYLNQDIFLNGNHLEEEVIFNAKGKHIEGIHQKVDQVRNLISAIRKNAAKGKEFYGGILYVHSNIGEELFSCQESFMLAVFLALLQVHDELTNFSSADIINFLLQADPSLSPRSLTAILGEYELGKYNVQLDNKVPAVESENELDLALCDPQSDKSIKTHDSNESIRIIQPTRSFKSTTSKGTLRHTQSTEATTNSKDSIESLVQEHESEISCIKLQLQTTNKLIVCKLDLSTEEQQAFTAKMGRIKELEKLAEQEGVDRFDLFQEEGQGALKDLTQEDRQLMHYCQETRALVQGLTAKRIQFGDFLAQKHDLDIKYQVFDEQVVELINQIHQEAPFLKNFCLIEGTVLLISMDKQYYPEIIRFLRRLFNDFKLSTCRFLETHRKLGEEKECQIGEIMFTSSPSLGCAIFNPMENCWL